MYLKILLTRYFNTIFDQLRVENKVLAQRPEKIRKTPYKSSNLDCNLFSNDNALIS